MKKKLIYTITLTCMLLVACSDDFTEIAPTGALSDEALQNAVGIDLKLTAAYSAMDGERVNALGEGVSRGGDNWWTDVVSDDAHRGSTDGDNTELFQLETLDWQTGNSWFLGRWSALFGGVNQANAVLALIDQVPDGDFSQQTGEALFLRGYFNFELQKFYGNVPFISLENAVNLEFNQPNPGPIWAEIEADFQAAIDNLGSERVTGRANSWVAKAFLGKAYLYQEKWDEAFALLNEVVTEGPYALNDEYVNNFNLVGENSSEAVFSIEFVADDGRSYNGNGAGTLNFPGGGPLGTCCGFYQPTQDLVNAYQTDGSGLPLLDTFADTDVTSDYGIESYELDAEGTIIEDADGNPVATPFDLHTGPLDPRLDYTVSRRGVDYNGFGNNPGKAWIRATFADVSGPYLPKKNVYQADEVDANRGTGGWGSDWSGINYNIMRFADVLLLAAEAAVEKSSPDLPLALEYVNRVRNRAKNMTYVQALDNNNVAIPDTDAANYQIEPYASFPDQAFARKAVRFERRLELGMEGHRLFDLRRWGVAEEVINTYIANEAEDINQSDYGRFGTYTDKYNLFPIPLTAIDQSGNILDQNPLY
ncbi:RagB/SusD family nutrient uptake outer membrane protein [Maribacter polysiphoniae]|uniref:RagB/SusD family nutrient uptake outer membrane protein n=2 Tax=Maribacter polysiphoniae TaxID=429344 RepID=A0ABR7W3N6_9FLAO|nr:RagB/SusD family nutrient uptake outer membrane protein [Maribacter polysiphoniae]MBD1262770.1 RagB/SusD family nutrient uptake outer membrane protein [Maribacter polysiphoniae]